MFRGFKALAESIGLLVRRESAWRSGSPDHTLIDSLGFDWGRLPSFGVEVEVAVACCFSGAAQEVAY